MFVLQNVKILCLLLIEVDPRIDCETRLINFVDYYNDEDDNDDDDDDDDDERTWRERAQECDGVGGRVTLAGGEAAT
jgi:hypothetical protein